MRTHAPVNFCRSNQLKPRSLGVGSPKPISSPARHVPGPVQPTEGADRGPRGRRTSFFVCGPARGFPRGSPGGPEKRAFRILPPDRDIGTDNPQDPDLDPGGQIPAACRAAAPRRVRSLAPGASASPAHGSVLWRRVARLAALEEPELEELPLHSLSINKHITDI